MLKALLSSEANFDTLLRPASDLSCDSKYFAGRFKPSLAIAAALAIALTFLETPALPALSFSAFRFAITAAVVPAGLPRPLFGASFSGVLVDLPFPRFSSSFSGVVVARTGVRPVAARSVVFAPSVDSFRVFRSRASGSFVNAFVDFCIG